MGRSCRYLVSFLRKIASCWVVVNHAFNLKIQEAESCDHFEFQDSLVYRVSSRIVRQSYRETL